MNDVRRKEPQLYLEPPPWLERLVPAMTRITTLFGFAIAVGLAVGELTWSPAPLNEGPPPHACDHASATASWSELGLSVEVESWMDGPSLLVLPDFAGDPPGTATRWDDLDIPRTRDQGLRSSAFARRGGEDACVTHLDGADSRVLATWEDGRWAMFDRTLTRIAAPSWLERAIRASSSAPLSALVFVLFAVAAWRARRRLGGGATVSCLAVGLAAVYSLPPWLEVL